MLVVKLIKPLKRLFSLGLVLMVFTTMTFASSQQSSPPSISTMNTKSDQLIPRSVLFSDPKRTQVQISPDGQYFSYLAPHMGVLNIWVGKANEPESMRPITQNTKRGINNYAWAYTNQHILYLDDNEGDENWRIHRVDIQTGENLALAAWKNVHAQILARSQHHPEEVLIAINQRRSDFHDVYKLNIVTGQQELVLENNNYTSFLADHDLNLKLAIESTPMGGARYYLLTKKSKLLKDYDRQALFSIDSTDMYTTDPIMFNKHGDILYLLDSRGRNTAALASLKLKDKKLEILAENKKADIGGILIHPTEKTIQAYSATYEKTEWIPIERSIESDLNYLNKLATGEMSVISRSLDDNAWIVVYQRDNGSPQYYFYQRPQQKAHFLFQSQPDLEGKPLAHMDPVIITSRDNLPLVSYLTLPNDTRLEPARAKHPVPLVLYVHGGPASRDTWGYNAMHQWLANRGYAVLSVNYRGSTGFGKQFSNAGNGEWAFKMNDDLVDAVNWAVKQGITTKDKVAIMGGSYGGYATLVGLTKNPELYACGIDIVGPSNLETLLLSLPEYWKPFYAFMKVMIGGDPETEEGRKFLAQRSPLNFVENIRKPLLIGQGANDPRVKQAESDQIVSAMKSKKIPVTYVLYPDEGHGFKRPENRMSFFAITEAFLSQHLGGKFQPIENDFQNSSVEIREGKENLADIWNR